MANPRRKKRPVWTDDLAYVVGLIATDGSMSNDGRHIYFTSKDLELAEQFKKILNLNVKIGKKSNKAGGEKLYYYVQFGDVVLYKWLNEIGISQNKSHTIGALDIPDQYFFHFLRGCFDGDGSSYGYFDKRWKNSFSLYIQFASASPDFLEWIQENVENMINISGSISFSSGVGQLRYSKKYSRIVFMAMYPYDNAPYLKRKKDKLIQLFEDASV